MKEFYRMPADVIMQRLNVMENGLADIRVEIMRKQYGKNILPEVTKPSPIMVFLSQFNDFLILVKKAPSRLEAIPQPSDAERYPKLR